MLRGLSQEALVPAIEAHQSELAVRWTRLQSGGVFDHPDLLVTITGLPVAFTNGAYRARIRIERAEARVAEVAQLFEDRGVPAYWWVGPTSQPGGLGSVLEARGFQIEERMPWMAARIDDAEVAELPNGVTAARVDGPESEAQWLEAMTAGFAMGEPERDAMTRLATLVGTGADAPWIRFVAVEDGSPVASSGIMFGGGVAGLYNMATRPRARGRGIGAAMASLAIRAARERGFEVAVLGSSALAVPLYQRLGFRHVCRIGVYRFG